MQFTPIDHGFILIGKNSKELSWTLEEEKRRRKLYCDQAGAKQLHSQVQTAGHVYTFCKLIRSVPNPNIFKALKIHDLEEKE